METETKVETPEATVTVGTPENPTPEPESLERTVGRLEANQESMGAQLGELRTAVATVAERVEGLFAALVTTAEVTNEASETATEASATAEEALETAEEALERTAEEPEEPEDAVAEVPVEAPEELTAEAEPEPKRPRGALGRLLLGR